MRLGRRALLYGMAILTALSLGAVVALTVLGGDASAQATAQSGIRITSISATPYLTSPMDVVTIGASFDNKSSMASTLAVSMIVRDEQGQLVLREKQEGLGAIAMGQQSVSWVWRVPARLSTGPYSVEMAVLDETGKAIAAETKADAFRVR